jgi:hypothetical protein
MNKFIDISPILIGRYEFLIKYFKDGMLDLDLSCNDLTKMCECEDKLLMYLFFKKKVIPFIKENSPKPSFEEQQSYMREQLPPQLRELPIEYQRITGNTVNTVFNIGNMEEFIKSIKDKKTNKEPLTEDEVKLYLGYDIYSDDDYDSDSSDEYNSDIIELTPAPRPKLMLVKRES